MKFADLTSQEQEQIANRYKSGEIMREIAPDFDVSSRTISDWLQRLNIQARKQSPSPDLVAEWIQEYKAGKSAYRLAKETGFCPTAIRNYLLKNNVVLRSKLSTVRKYRINETFFDHIDSQRKAYWLGFIFADGYCRRQFVIQLADCDREHLVQLLRDLESTHPIAQVAKNQSRLCISNAHLAKALARFPVTPKARLQYPDILPEFHPHFIRGYMDGDGGFYAYDSPRAIFSITTNHFRFLDQVQSHISVGCGVHSITPRRTSHNSYEIRWSAFKDVELIFKYFYHEAVVWLPRKREHVEHLFIQSSCSS